MLGTSKTTYQDLQAASNSGINALLGALTPQSIRFKTKVRLAKLAQHYIHAQDLPKTGVVIFYNGSIQGWTNTLRDPHCWKPGCIAITSSGDAFTATGGNDQQGAATWQLLTTTHD